MAQHVRVRLVDDVDGSEASETVTFALDGRTYEIDLSEARAGGLRAALEPYVAAGRRAAASTAQTGNDGPARRREPTSPAGAEDTAAIRGWARERGFEISDRGRIPARVRRAYEQEGRGGPASGADPEPASGPELVSGAGPVAVSAEAGASVGPGATGEPETAANAGAGRSLPPVANPFAVPSTG